MTSTPALPDQVRLGLTALRIIPALLIVAHGVFRITTGGVAPFGEFLGSKGLPLGLVVAWTLSVVEVVGGLTVAAGWMVRPLSLWFALELTMGIILVHAPSGWFVVGGGRNGMEFSVLLISCHLINALIAPTMRGSRL